MKGKRWNRAIRNTMRRCLALVMMVAMLLSLVVPGMAASASEEKVLNCRYFAHEHTGDCFADGVLSCGMVAPEEHVHGEACFGYAEISVEGIDSQGSDESTETEENIKDEESADKEADVEKALSLIATNGFMPIADGVPEILVNNIVLGNKEYAGSDYDGLDKHTATRMKTGANNSVGNGYVVYVGKTLDVGVVTDEDNRYSFESSDPEVLRIGAVQRDGAQWTAQFDAVKRGTCEITLKDNTTGDVKDTFYVNVPYPIYVVTALGEYNKHTVHEYLSLLWNGPPSNFITDPNGNRLYVKNDNYSDDFRYCARPGDTLVLSSYTEQGGPDQFVVPGNGLTVLEQDTETVNGLTRVYVKFQADTPGYYTITFGEEPFYLKVENNNKTVGHFDIEVADGAICTVNEFAVKVAKDGTKTTTSKTRQYDAEISDVRGSVVYNAAGQPICRLEWWEYWNQNNPNMTQCEYTSAYWTNKNRELTQWDGITVLGPDREEQVRSGNAFGEVRDRNVKYQDISSVVFDVNVDLLKDGAKFKGLQDLLIPMMGQDILDAHNKCPLRSGLDFAVQLKVRIVSVALDGYKDIEGRPWSDVDDGAYSFTMTPVGDAPMPEGTNGSCKVKNNGHDIQFPDIEFWNSGTYQYRIIEDDLDADAPGYVTKDNSVINVTIEVNLDAENNEDVVNVTYSGGNEEGELTFKNKYEGPEKTETDPGADELVRVGAEVTYQITWQNYKTDNPDTDSEDESLVTVTVTDRLDPGVEFVSASYGGTTLDDDHDGTGSDKYGAITISYDEGTHTVTWTLEGRPNKDADPDFGKGAVWLTVCVTEKAIYKWEYDNDADGSADVGTEKDYEIHNQAKVAVNNDPAVKTDVIDNPVNDPHKVETDPGENLPVQVGQEITYQITWQNYKDYATTVTIVDPLDENVQFVEADNGGVYEKDSHTVIWMLEDCEAKSDGVVTLKVLVLNSAVDVGEVINTATVQVDNDEEVNLEEPHNPVPKLHKVETDPGDGKAVSVGQNITYEITWNNYRGEAAKVILTDPLDAGVEFVSASAGGTYDKTTHTVTWDLGIQQSGATGKVTLVVKVTEKAKDYVKNQAFEQVGDDPLLETEIPRNPLKNDPLPETEVPENPLKNDTPNTGDNNNLCLWVVLMLISAIGFCGVALSRNCKRKTIK